MQRVFIDVNSMGIGNLVLVISGFLLMCRENHWIPVVSCADLFNLAGLQTSLFEVTDSKPDLPQVHPSMFCNKRTNFNPLVAAIMCDVVRPPPGLEDAIRTVGACDAGFCIRVEDQNIDGSSKFMSEKAIAAMKREMALYRRVFVCSNDARHLVGLPPNAIVYEHTTSTERNVLSHWVQWHLLSRCPVVYHGVSDFHGEGRIASTFGPTAAAYGGQKVIGLDSSSGAVVAEYRW